jgi:hypothetical protein
VPYNPDIPKKSEPSIQSQCCKALVVYLDPVSDPMANPNYVCKRCLQECETERRA